MYFSKFKKDSPGIEQYGRGGVLLFKLFYKEISIRFGVKKRRTSFNFSHIKFNNHHNRYKMYIYYFYLFFYILSFDIRIISKTTKNFAQNIWRIKKGYLHLRKK